MSPAVQTAESLDELGSVVVVVVVVVGSVGGGEAEASVGNRRQTIPISTHNTEKNGRADLAAPRIVARVTIGTVLRSIDGDVDVLRSCCVAALGVAGGVSLGDGGGEFFFAAFPSENDGQDDSCDEQPADC